jgi:hypothetical protein
MPGRVAHRLTSGEAVCAAGVILSLLSVFASFLLVPKLLVPSFSESLASAAFFVLLPYLAGLTLTRGVFSSDDPFERAVMRIGFGLCALPLVFVAFEDAGVRLRWPTLITCAMALPVYRAISGLGSGAGRKAAFRPDAASAAAYVIFSAAFLAALWGSYQYPYLEDGDSWGHAVGAKYVSLFGSYRQPQGANAAHYLEPYPPSYDVLMGVTHQLNSSVSWTLKVFNSLLVALTYLFAFYTVRRLCGDGLAAAGASFCLLVLPPFGSHVIWAHTLSAAALFPVFYAADRIRESRGWAVLSAIFLAGSMLVQPLMTPIMVAFYTLFSAARSYYHPRELPRLAAAGALAVALSLIYWVPTALGGEGSEMGGIADKMMGGDFKVGLESPDKLPTPADLLFPRVPGNIYMQEGFGAFAALLAAFSIPYAIRMKPKGFLRRNPWLAATALWLAFGLCGLFSAAFEVSVHPARFWGIAAVPVGILGGFMLSEAGRLRLPRPAVALTALFLVAGLALYSGYPKYQIQTVPWPTDLQFEGYMALANLSADTAVYPFCSTDAYVIGLDKLSFPWDPEVAASRNGLAQADPETLHAFLRRKGYGWVVFDLNCVWDCTDRTGMQAAECKDRLTERLLGLQSSRLFWMERTGQMTVLFRVL